MMKKIIRLCYVWLGLCASLQASEKKFCVVYLLNSKKSFFIPKEDIEKNSEQIKTKLKGIPFIEEGRIISLERAIDESNNPDDELLNPISQENAKFALTSKQFKKFQKEQYAKEGYRSHIHDSVNVALSLAARGEKVVFRLDDKGEFKGFQSDVFFTGKLDETNDNNRDTNKNKGEENNDRDDSLVWKKYLLWSGIGILVVVVVPLGIWLVYDQQKNKKKKKETLNNHGRLMK